MLFLKFEFCCGVGVAEAKSDGGEKTDEIRTEHQWRRGHVLSGDGTGSGCASVVDRRPRRVEATETTGRGESFATKARRFFCKKKKTARGINQGFVPVAVMNLHLNLGVLFLYSTI